VRGKNLIWSINANFLDSIDARRKIYPFSSRRYCKTMKLLGVSGLLKAGERRY
jgi:hypothetical protein